MLVILICTVAAGYQVTSKNSGSSQQLIFNNQSIVTNQGSSPNEA